MINHNLLVAINVTVHTIKTSVSGCSSITSLKTRLASSSPGCLYVFCTANKTQTTANVA